MKLIIDIPEKMYNRIAKFEECVKDRKIVITAIQNGTSLPSHGNLVDIDKLYDTVFNPRNGILEIYKDRPREQLENELESVFDDASIIIPADKEE